MFRKLAISTALLLGSLSASHAADDLERLKPFTDWSGFYAGVHAGAVDSATTMRDDHYTVLDAEGGTFFTNDLTGLFGIHGGYNWQEGNPILGVEMDYSWTDAGRSRQFDGTDHIASSQIDGFGSLRGRAGLALDNAHIFVTAGVGYVDATVNAQDSFPNQFVERDDFYAFVAGVGAEVKLRSDVSARLEFSHYMFDNESTTCIDCVESQVFGGSLNMLRAGLTYHLGQSPEPVELAGNNVWSGFYVGGHMGALDSATRVQDESGDTLNTEGASIFTNSLDAAGGIHVGYNHAVGSAIFGLEADYTFTNSGFTRFLDNGDEFLSSEIDGIASIRARLGVAAGNAHVYATGGVALIDGQIIASDDLTNPAETVSYDDFTALVMGAGAEVKVSPKVSVRGEYLYYAFDEQGVVCGACGADSVLADGGIHTFRLGATYHLNGDAVEAETVEVTDWSGFYAGGHASYIASQTGIRDENDYSVAEDEGVTYFTTLQDVGAGLYGGYNVQWGNAVAGVEVDYTFVDANEFRPIDGASEFKSSQIDGFGSVRGRLGLAVGDSLFYATGGIGFVDASLAGGMTVVPTRQVQYDDFTALVAGVGTEFKLADNMSARLEYQYYGFDEKTKGCTHPTRCIDPTYADGELHIFRGGITFHLN